MDLRTIYKKLIKAYYSGDFEKEVQATLNTFHNEEEAKKAILSVVGVEIDTNESFIFALSKAISLQTLQKKVITHWKNGVNQITCPFLYNEEDCIACGACLKENNDVTYTKEMIPILSLLKEKKKVIALVAPSISGQFKVSKNKIKSALKCIGFIDMLDVAFAADILTLIEAYNYHKYREHSNLMLTSCCCPIWVSLIKNKFKEAIKYTSPTVSPMIAAGRIMKTLNKDIYTVFIGPCIAKKQEIKQEDIKDAIDYVLTFEELEDTFEALNINLFSFEEIPEQEYCTRSGLLYPTSGGISEACKDVVSELYPEISEGFHAKAISGIEECKSMLATIIKNKASETFIEGLACKGGCVNGPKVLVHSSLSFASCHQAAYSSSFRTPLHNKILKDMLNKLNIHSLEELATSELFHRKF